ncbi:MAG: YciI family protein [Cytophagaceae bacterium]|nr:YciI family protein [Cytophagaceae bacterium]
MTQKKEFMLLFRYEPNHQYQPTASELEEMHQQWGAFIGTIALQEKLVSTYQLGMEGQQIKSNASVQEGFHVSDRQIISGNMLVQCQSMEEAVALAKACPILSMGGTVEVRNIIPMV